MSFASETLLEQARSLSPSDRARIASGLLARLDEDQADEEEVERLWSEESERGMALLGSCEARLINWDHVTERIDGLRNAINR